jgi:hypothetical protein
MNVNQRQQVLEMLDNISNVNIEEKFIERYAGESDFTKISIGKYSAAEILALISKMTIQLKNELENGLKYFLPFTENYSNDYGTVNLVQDLNSLYSYILNIQFESVEVVLDKLIHYQIKNGFWDKSSIKSHSVDIEEINKQKKSIDLNQKALSKNIENYRELNQNIESKITKLDDFLINKKEEMIQISDLLENAKKHLSEINNIEGTIKNKETEIKGLLSNISDKVEAVTININNYQVEFEEIKSKNTSLKTELENSLKQALTDQEKSREGITFIAGHKNEIIRLTGMAADGSLGSKFEDRQNKISTGLKFWRWAVPIATAFSLLWVIIVFTCLAVHTDNVWINLLINLVKTTPVFILLGFVFKQYNKERNLQEEYAFKSSVAMTLTAYSDMLSKADTQDNESRQQMLLKSIELVYNQPHIYPEKTNRIFSFNTKDLNETVTTLTEALKNIKQS